LSAELLCEIEELAGAIAPTMSASQTAIPTSE